MTKPFAHCSLPDFALEISLAACAAAGSALDAAAAAQLLPRLTDAEATASGAATPPACSKGERAGVHWQRRE
jgi:hypothetical protein